MKTTNNRESTKATELNKSLNELARKCIRKQEGWGTRYIKGTRKGKKRKIYLLDEYVLNDILKFLQPYIWRCVVNSKGRFDEDLASILRAEVWKVLRVEGYKNFASNVKLRIMNICTTQHNIKQRSLTRNANVTAVSIYNEYGTEEGEMIMLDTLPDSSNVDTSSYALLDQDESKVLQELTSLDADGKRKEKKYYKEFVSSNFNTILRIYNKIM